MGKKDSKNAISSSPIENHRKQIGKQEMKRAKKEMKVAKKHLDQKRSAMTIQEVILVVGALLAVVAGIYFFFMYQLGTQWSPEKIIPENTKQDL
ncbi:hypothetical protein SNE40_007405 [Patella caerulea]|uniref:Triple QxxK/R motif-containing protein n=1 Tax=Patella caerulea TaxID=87958 RepID=A0AAN8JXL5_PATCE